MRILLGRYAGKQGVIKDPLTDVQYFDVALAVGRNFQHTLRADDSAFIYVFEGSAMLGDTAGTDGARFIFVAGKPLHEPVVQYGPFVMNSREEINQAMRDFGNNSLVRKKAAMRTSA